MLGRGCKRRVLQILLKRRWGAAVGRTRSWKVHFVVEGKEIPLSISMAVEIVSRLSWMMSNTGVLAEADCGSLDLLSVLVVAVMVFTFDLDCESVLS